MYRYTYIFIYLYIQYIYIYLYTYPNPLTLKVPPFLPGNARNVAVGPCEVPGGDRSGGKLGRVFFVRISPGPRFILLMDEINL